MPSQWEKWMPEWFKRLSKSQQRGVLIATPLLLLAMPLIAVGLALAGAGQPPEGTPAQAATAGGAVPGATTAKVSAPASALAPGDVVLHIFDAARQNDVETVKAGFTQDMQEFGASWCGGVGNCLTGPYSGYGDFQRAYTETPAQTGEAAQVILRTRWSAIPYELSQNFKLVKSSGGWLISEMAQPVEELARRDPTPTAPALATLAALPAPYAACAEPQYEKSRLQIGLYAALGTQATVYDDAKRESSSGALEAGAVVQIMGGPECSSRDGFFLVMWEMRSAQDQRGWIAENESRDTYNPADPYKRRYFLTPCLSASPCQAAP